MRIAIPVLDQSMAIFANAGHAPFFAVFAAQGEGMFRQYVLEDLRANPRVEAGTECAEEAGGTCNHDEEDEESKEKRNAMAAMLNDCDILLAKRACKHTTAAFEAAGVKVQKYPALQSASGASIMQALKATS